MRKVARRGRFSFVVAALVAAALNGRAAAASTGSVLTPPASGEATAIGEMKLPHRTIVHADGTVEKIADKQAVVALRALDGGCGYACDGKDPNSYVFNGATCASGDYTYTVYSQTPAAGKTFELRFSGLCQTAWTRSCCYVRGGGFGYNANGTQRSFVYNSGGQLSGNRTWTAMLYDSGSLTYSACIDRVLTGSGHDWACGPRW
ncbi:DUF2690 domain-containing protein [Amycolatopsis sp. NPDC051045]|uniref:DUF2690 domain-containing protein n=1 Tax=Amycolatopsis sp. NPDC051045 TaxID=3156922 RepID=UPI0034273F16